MHYRVGSERPGSHFIEIEARVENVATPHLEIQLPAWRPGRYELQNFAKNVQKFAVLNAEGEPLPFRKITKDRWLIDTQNAQTVVVKYNYYAHKKDAGSSFVDETLFYLNPVNLCVYTEGRLHEPCTLQLALPENYTVACGLPQTTKHTFEARDYYALVDSPLVASATIQCGHYEVDSVRFYVWIEGQIAPNWERILANFRAFTAVQIQTMGEFPEAEYHFINLILTEAFYHGVEHRNSTVVVLGPNDNNEGFHVDLLGVSSHELFHSWNAIRIRPQELMPYDFTRENYFSTCFVVEGLTTYYGDLFLKRAGVFSEADYLKELEVYCKRHFEHNGRAAQSLTESSFDLWLDGYSQAIPDRKVSVYHKGALVALILDLTIRKIHAHQRSIDDVARTLWQHFGKPFVGYSYQNYVDIAQQTAQQNLDWYFEECILGHEPLENRLNEALAWVGLALVRLPNGAVQINKTDDAAAAVERAKWLGATAPPL